MSVVSDIVDIGRNLLTGAHNRVPSRSFRGESLTRVPVRSIDELRTRYYLRFQVADRPGVLGKIATHLGEAQVSIEQMFQHGTAGDEKAMVVVLTHVAREGDVKSALAKIDRLEEVVAPTRLLRVDD
jgi:homoserine dehydrogenase